MAKPIDVDAVRVMQHVTMRINVKRRRELRVRNWLGCRLIVLAAWIMNCNLDLTTDEDA